MGRGGRRGGRREVRGQGRPAGGPGRFRAPRRRRLILGDALRAVREMLHGLSPTNRPPKSAPASAPGSLVGPTPERLAVAQLLRDVLSFRPRPGSETGTARDSDGRAGSPAVLASVGGRA